MLPGPLAFPYNGGVRRLVCPAALVGMVLLVGGCASDDEPSTDEDKSGNDKRPPPSIELEVLELEVSAAEVGEVTLPVAHTRRDTRVDVDGQELRVASIVDDTLHLPLGGAMVVGPHELTLIDRAGTSEPLLISIVESQPGLLEPTLLDGVVGIGDRLLSHGHGVDAALALLDETDARARVWAGQWSADGFALELPGLLPVADQPIMSRAWVDVSIAELPGDERWVVATWLAEHGDIVRARVAPVDELGVPTAEPGEVLDVWRLDDPDDTALLGPHELAQLDAVALLDRMIVLAVDARRDAEQPTIGDRVLVTRWLAADGSPAPAVLVRGPNSRDLDLPGDARLWTPLGFDTALSIRVGLGFPWLLSVASNGLPQLGNDPGVRLALPTSSVWMRSADGAFGSRHAFAIDGALSQPHVRVLWVNRWSTAGDELAGNSELIELPAWPSASPELAIFDGVPTLVLPMGADADVLALRSTGATVRIDELAGLRCDALALANPGTDGIGDTLPLACLRAHELRRGFLGRE